MKQKHPTHQSIDPNDIRHRRHIKIHEQELRLKPRVRRRVGLDVAAHPQASVSIMGRARHAQVSVSDRASERPTPHRLQVRKRPVRPLHDPADVRIKHPIVRRRDPKVAAARGQERAS